MELSQFRLLVSSWIVVLIAFQNLVQFSLGHHGVAPHVYKCCDCDEYLDLTTLRCEKANNINLRNFPIVPGFYARTYSKNHDEDFNEDYEVENIILANHPIEDSYYYNYEIDDPEDSIDTSSYTNLLSNNTHSHMDHSDEDHSDEDHSDEDHSDEDHSHEGHSDEGHSDEDHSGKNHSHEDHSDEGHSDEDHSGKNHSHEDHSDEDHSDEDHSGKNHSDEDHSGKNHSDEDHSDEDHDHERHGIESVSHNSTKSKHPSRHVKDSGHVHDSSEEDCSNEKTGDESPKIESADESDEHRNDEDSSEKSHKDHNTMSKPKFHSKRHIHHSKTGQKKCHSHDIHSESKSSKKCNGHIGGRAKDFEIIEVKMPKCDNNTYELKYAVGSLIDSRSMYSIHYLSEKNKTYAFLKEDSTTLFQKSFCVDTGFKKRYSNIFDEKYGDFKELTNNLNHGLKFEGTIIAFCSPKETIDCTKRPCINSCCPLSQVVDSRRGTCRPATPSKVNRKWKADLYDPDTKRVSTKEEIRKYWNSSSKHPIRFFYDRHNSLQCETRAYNLNRDAWIYKTGKAFAEKSFFDYSQYCVQTVERIRNSTIKFTYTHMIKVCVQPNFVNYNFIVNQHIIPILSIFSAVCLCLLFIYTWMKNHSTAFTAMVLCLLATMAAFHLLLSAIKMGGDYLVHEHKITCTVLGFLQQFSHLSSFFWLNAMIFYLWMKFRDLESPRIDVSIYKKTTTIGCIRPCFKWYALYSWGAAFQIVSLTILIQYLPEKLQERLLLPLVGKSQCFQTQSLATLLYLHLILGFVFCADLFFLFNMARNKKLNDMSQPSKTGKLQKYTKNLKIVLKIFVAMSFTWLTDLVSFSVVWKLGKSETYKYLAVLDFFNSLQGLMVLTAMVMNSNIFAMMDTKSSKILDPSKTMGKIDKINGKNTLPVLLSIRPMTTRP